jgi:hypothetical protein
VTALFVYFTLSPKSRVVATAHHAVDDALAISGLEQPLGSLELKLVGDITWHVAHSIYMLLNCSNYAA